MLLTIIAFIIIFSVLILIHEWGHFTMARRAGIKVEEFGIGLPPRAKELYKDKKGTIYSLNWIPFGGYVKLFGEDSIDPKVLKDKKSFASKTVAQRTSVILAGVFMNFVLAWILITFGFTFGMKPFLVTPEDLQKGIKEGLVTAEQVFYVHEINKDGALIETEIKSGDFITAVDGIPVSSSMVLSDIIQPEEMVMIDFTSGEEKKSVAVRADADGKVGMVISLENNILDVKEISYPFYIAPIKSLQEIGRLSKLTVKMLGNVVVSLIAKFTVPAEVAGPVGIARMTHYFAQQGLMALIQFTALLSISLGVINVMPFPALDGGRFLFILFEIITRRRPNPKWETIIHTIGFALLMLLIFIITWNDIMNLF